MSTPTEIAEVLVPRFLADGAMTTAQICSEFHVNLQTAQQAVRLSREVLGDEFNVVLPVAHWSSDFVLTATTSASEALAGELPQVRALRTRYISLVKRFNRILSLVSSKRKTAKTIVSMLDGQLAQMELVLNHVEAWAEDEIEQQGSSK